MGNWMKGSLIEERHNDIRSSIVCGNQWGDTGKGKITDILAQYSDVIIRFQGGHNAGHTVVVGDKTFDLHILPSGMVSEGKINIITSGCVLGINLGKVDLSKIELTKAGLICKSSLDDFLRRDKESGKKIQVGLIPELQKLTQGGVDIKKSGLKISGETTVIGMHNVILDAYDEICRKAAGLELIGSTGSGISRAYASEMQRYHFTLNDLLYHPDNFYSSIEALWDAYQHVFPNISTSELIDNVKKEREDIMEYIKRGEIEIIGNETQYIKKLHRKGKRIVGEGAQGAMIGSGNSFFGTASQPGLQAFCDTTGLTSAKVGNIFLVNKFPGSSVGTRPGYLKYPDSQELDWFRNKYQEFGVSTGRPRDLFRYSLPEIARGSWLNVRGIDTEDKIVPVYNRVDGIEDALKIDKGLMRVVTGFQYNFDDIVNQITTNIKVGVHGNEALEPRNLLRNYPEKSAQANLFHLDESNLRMVEINGKSIEEQVEQLLGIHNAAIFKKSPEREFLIGTGPDRDDLELRKGSPVRRLVDA